MSERLYDLARDPLERTDVATANPAVVTDLRRRLAEELASRPLPDAATANMSEDVVRQLRDLGNLK